MFKKFVNALIEANSNEEIMDILYSQDGVDLMYQKGKLKWEDHETLFALADKLLKLNRVDRIIERNI